VVKTGCKADVLMGRARDLRLSSAEDSRHYI